MYQAVKQAWATTSMIARLAGRGSAVSTVRARSRSMTLTTNEPPEWNWARTAAKAARSLLEAGAESPGRRPRGLPQHNEDVPQFLQALWNVFEPLHPGPNQVHSKGLDIATAEGEYFGLYSLDTDALHDGVYRYGYGDDLGTKRFVAGAISPLLYDGRMDWMAREVRAVDPGGATAAAAAPQRGPCAVQPSPFYVWECGGDEGLDMATGEPYDVRVRPWYRHAVEAGEGFTPPYPDPVTGEGMVSYVIPLFDGGSEADCDGNCPAGAGTGGVIGVIIAGSFLDSAGDFPGVR